MVRTTVRGGGGATGSSRDRGTCREGQAAPPQPAPPQPDDDTEVVVAGLVGTGGGGLTALIFAARESDVESARALLDAGADVNQTTEYGWTPLLTAINNRNYRLASLLIARGADVNFANQGAWTPLYLATDNRNIEGGDYPVPKPAWTTSRSSGSCSTREPARTRVSGRTRSRARSSRCSGSSRMGQRRSYEPRSRATRS